MIARRRGRDAWQLPHRDLDDGLAGWWGGSVGRQTTTVKLPTPGNALKITKRLYASAPRLLVRASKSMIMTTSMPVHGRFTILDYRGFYDVPRIMLAKDEQNLCWIFECLFDDSLDEYADTYTAYLVGEEGIPLSLVLQRHYDDPPVNAQCVLAVSRFHFDPTTRVSFEIA